MIGTNEEGTGVSCELEGADRVALFTYGTLRPGGRWWVELLAGVELDTWPATLADAHLVDGPGYPLLVLDEPAAADPERRPRDNRATHRRQVVGDIVWVHATDWPTTREALDALEGVDIGLFRRTVRTVRTVRPLSAAGSGDEVDAVVYVATPSTLERLGASEVIHSDWFDAPSPDAQRGRVSWEAYHGRPYRRPTS